mmetsp:Transcript_41794/g.97861  ORF Transcript_41794/g.97861 Transcript_41794/m.97861 type:complete len:338 (+) Transcript_41794:532-1545(+)
MGIKTTENHRFYGLSAPLAQTFNNKGKTLVLQYTVKHEQNIDCGGAYIKILPGGSDFDAQKFGGDSPYSVMFGPDVCGSTRRTHVIFNYPPKDDNVLITKDILCEKDNFSHMYRLVVQPDNTFEVFIDGKSVRHGKLEDEFNFLEEKEIKDPAVSKPEDWIDEKKIPDPNDVKPEGYDDISPEVPDSDASKPEDWDDEDDGEWEPPMIPNPDYNGPWRQKQIDNPEYKGEWEHPIIPNPGYIKDDELYNRCVDCTHIGFEIWQVTAGTLFDDIILTDSIEEAQAFAEETFYKKKDPEAAMKNKMDKEENDKKAADKAEDENDGMTLDDIEDADGEEL